MPSSEQICESIEARLTELRSEKTSLEAARAALHTNGASRARSRPTGAAVRKPTRRRPSPPASEATTTTQADQAPEATPPAATSEQSTRTAVRSRKPRVPTQSKPTARRKPVAVLLARKLETMLGDAEDGLNAVSIAKEASARDAQVRGLLREVESAGRVRRTGTGRASRWRLITDEERIAERAAELEALSTSKA